MFAAAQCLVLIRNRSRCNKTQVSTLITVIEENQALIRFICCSSSGKVGKSKQPSKRQRALEHSVHLGVSPVTSYSRENIN